MGFRTYIFCIIIFLLTCRLMQLTGQIITAEPFFPTEDDSVVITYDATKGNKGLMGFTGDVYAHTGVITSLSNTPSDWKYAPIWGDNSSKYKLTRIGQDLYQLIIAPNIKEYYGILTGETVKQLAFVFRSADMSREGKTETGGDIFYDVYEPGLNVRLLKPSQKPLLVDLNDTIEVEAHAIDADSIFLSLDNNIIKRLPGNDLIDTIIAGIDGKHWIKITAINTENSVSDSVYYYIKSDVIIEDIPAGVADGINYINDSTVTLVLFAPGKQFVFALGDFSNWELENQFLMRKSSDGQRFWITLEDIDPGEEYIFQYYVDGEILIGDPYAEKVSDPWNDKWIDDQTYPGLKPYPESKTTGIATFFQTSQESYEWQINNFESPEKENLIIYELLIRDFIPGHTYLSLIDTLGYLDQLGINAIELMPVNEFEGNLSWGYNPSYYFAPDKYYGPKNDLKKFIDECHKRGIAVILDLVLNHSFGQSPMVMLYWDSANGRPSADNPWFNQVAKHDYNVGYDMNHESSYTKEFVYRVIKFWIREYRMDGYRFDLSKGFTQNNTLGDVSEWGRYDNSRIAILKDYADTIWSVDPDAYVILEHFADNDEEQELTEYGMMVWGNSNYNYSRAGMGWNYDGKSDFSWGSYKTRNFSLPHLVTYMESHDEERIVREILDWGNYKNPNYNIRDNLTLSLIRAELCAAFFFTLPGPKMIWQFGEMGYDYSINFNGRTGPKPIRWDYYNEPGRKRLYQIYSELIKLRLTNNVFQSNDYIIDVNDTLKTIHIQHSSMDVTVIGNFDTYPQKIDPAFTKSGTWYDFFSGDSISVSDIHEPVELNKSEYRIYTTKRLICPDIIAAPKAIDVSITGNAGVGETLTGSYQYFDSNGDLEGTSLYKWYKGIYANGSGKTEISGSGEITYTLTESDMGYYLFFEVTPVAQAGELLYGIPEVASFDVAVEIEKFYQVDKTVQIYPNPSTHGFQLSINGLPDQPVTLKIYNLFGQLVYQSNLLNSSGPAHELLWEEIDTGENSIKSGIYLLKIQINTETIVRRLVKL